MSLVSRRRTGFTLIEFLVVVGVVIVLAAIAVPWILAQREDARRNQCKNNLKQIGLAILHYGDSANSLPPGWIGVNAQGTHDVRGDNGWGWSARLLPFISEANLYKQIDWSSRMDGSKSLAMCATPRAGAHSRGPWQFGQLAPCAIVE
jgi:type II secretory pathway pseudopilin PulG